MTETRWWTYVQRVIGGDSYKDAARRSGFDQSAFTRWRKGAQPDVAFVVKFARGYHQSVLEALVEAEIITDTEAQLNRVPVGRADVLRTISTEELADELSRRIHDAHTWWAAYEEYMHAQEAQGATSSGQADERETKSSASSAAGGRKRLRRTPLSMRPTPADFAYPDSIELQPHVTPADRDA